MELYRALAHGGVGLIVTGIMGVWKEALLARQVRANDDSCIPGLKRISTAVLPFGNGCKIMAQLHHPGRQIVSPEGRTSLLPYLPPALLKVMQKCLWEEETHLGAGAAEAVPNMPGALWANEPISVDPA